MSSKAYAVQLRNDLPSGLMQVLDLRPNTSQRNAIYEGEGKTGYISNSQAVDLSAPTLGNDGGGNKTFDGESTGLVAYLIERVHNNVAAADTHLTVAQAQKCASLIIADVLNGTDIDSARITVHLTAICGGAVDLVGNADESWGSVEDVVKILAGHSYTIADGSIFALVAANEFQTEAERTATAGSSQTGSFATFSGKQVYQGSSFNNSIANGNLSQYVSSSFALSNSKAVSGIRTVNHTYGVDQKEESSYTYDAKAVLGTTILPVVATISSSTVAPLSVFTTSAAHGLAVGDKVWLVHHNGTLVRTGSSTGAFLVKTVPLATTFTLEDADGDIECTVALSAGSVVLTDGTARYSIPKSTASVGANLSAVVGQHSAVRYIDEDGVILG
jgi:hypothetical protein